jgi:hypothetical protein
MYAPFTFTLLLLLPAILGVVAQPHLFLPFPALQELDKLSGDRLETEEDAKTYVRNSAAAFGIAEASFLPNRLESRLSEAELNAAKETKKLVSDDQIAEAFNFLSDEFRVAKAERLSGADILLYRSVKASMFPRLFNPKTVSGSRPVGALIILDTLTFEGGIMEGVRKAAELDRPPGSLKITGGQIVGRLGNSTSQTQREYRTAALNYFAQHSSQEIEAFLDRLAEILGLPD